MPLETSTFDSVSYGSRYSSRPIYGSYKGICNIRKLLSSMHAIPYDVAFRFNYNILGPQFTPHVMCCVVQLDFIPIGLLLH